MRVLSSGAAALADIGHSIMRKQGNILTSSAGISNSIKNFNIRLGLAVRNAASAFHISQHDNTARAHFNQ